MLLIPVKQQLGLQAALKCCFQVVFCTLGSAVSTEAPRDQEAKC